MSEFARFIAPWLFSVSTSAQEVAAAFRGFDADGDGTISLPELRSVLSRGEDGMSKAEIEEIVRLAGRRGSGSLDYREFAAMIGHP